MDWTKILLERFFGFLATLIPGGAILLLFILHEQIALTSFWRSEALGYQMKIAVVVFATFVVGFSVQYLLGVISASIAGGIRGAIQSGKKEAGYDKEPLQPWRNSMWRSLMKSHLGASAPPDVRFINNELLEERVKLVSLITDENQRIQSATEVMLEKSAADIADYQWAAWWDQLHLPSLLGQTSSMGVIRSHLLTNFETAALVLFVGMLWTPALRYWWIFAFCLAWLLSMILRIAYIVTASRDPWTSFQGQIDYLRNANTREGPVSETE